jgi:hypothetical protein
LDRKTPRTLTNLELGTSSLAPLIQATVGDLRLEKQTIKVAKYPLLETEDPVLRKFIAVGSGCDALPGGGLVLDQKLFKKNWRHNAHSHTSEASTQSERRNSKYSWVPFSLRCFTSQGTLQMTVVLLSAA